VSLNYRDLIITQGEYPFAQKDGVVPVSDGAGIVESVGRLVHRFQAGDKVLTLFNQAHFGGSLDPYIVATGVGGTIDGSLRQYGAYDEQGLVHMPKNLNFLEGSTLTCAALTAWNGLYGLESRALKQGDVVLTQGTGGVSIFALQFAKAAGATVIATTSSAKKAEILKKLGADHVINYKEDANWGETAKKFTPNGEGVTHVLEVGGPTTMKQVYPLSKFSLKDSLTLAVVPSSHQNRRRHIHYRFHWRHVKRPTNFPRMSQQYLHSTWCARRQSVTIRGHESCH
jgi:NADPH:quinone reductase-like Zn-dependent oxidoreductase